MKPRKAQPRLSSALHASRRLRADNQRAGMMKTVVICNQYENLLSHMITLFTTAHKVAGKIAMMDMSEGTEIHVNLM